MSQLSMQFSKERQHNKLPLAVTKSDLRFIFSSSDVPITVYSLHKKFLTEKFITTILNITMQEYKELHCFDFEQTQIIYDFFKVNRDDL